MNDKKIKTLVDVQYELKAPKGQFNKFGNYAYRSCEDIMEALKPLLKEANATLTISDEPILIGERYYIKATATYKSESESVSVSAYAREALAKKGMDESQITGSTSSYARKYALNGLFVIDDTKDADATNNHDKDTNQNNTTNKTNSNQRLTSNQKAEISELISSTNTNINDVLSFFKAYSIDNLPYELTKDMLIKKLGKQNAQKGTQYAS